MALPSQIEVRGAKVHNLRKLKKHLRKVKGDFLQREIKYENYGSV